MPPSTVARSVALWVAGSGGIPAGNEATLVAAVRRRLNQKFDRSARTTTKVSAFLFGMEPILDYLKGSFSGQQIRALTRRELALRVHGIFERVAHRTELFEKYAAVLESVEEWHSVEAGLQSRLSGKAVTPPNAGSSLPSRHELPPAAALSSWWSRRRAVSIFLLICVVVFYQFKHLFKVDKHRVDVYFLCILLIVLGILYELKGPDVAPGFLPKTFDKASEESFSNPELTTEPEVSVDEFPSYEGAAQELDSRSAEANAGGTKVDKLANEMAQIRALVLDLNEASPASAPRQSVSPNPISLHATLPPRGDPMPIIQPNAWSPLTNPRRSAVQAAFLFDKLNRWSGGKSTNPLWGVDFWHEVGRFEHEQTLEPDLLRVLHGYGYFGAQTRGAPRESLMEALRGLRDAGAVPAGDPGFPPSPPGLCDSVAIPTDARWQQGLPPDLKRAAPEIYCLCRAEGANNLREWINRRFQGEKSNKNPTWIHAWHTATECDFAVMRAGVGNEMALLASDDGLEMKLRELASCVHYWRTGDLSSSTNMLAVKPPGTETDVAPSWLVDESTNLSHAERQRQQRVKTDRDKGRDEVMKGEQPRAIGRGSGAGGK